MYKVLIATTVKHQVLVSAECREDAEAICRKWAEDNDLLQRLDASSEDQDIATEVSVCREYIKGQA